MKVKELIQLLSVENPEAFVEVTFNCFPDGGGSLGIYTDHGCSDYDVEIEIKKGN